MSASASSPAASSSSQSGETAARQPSAYAREIDLLLVLYLAVIVCAILYPASFLSLDNLRVILNNLAIDGILAIGMMGLMIAGVFDLSVGSMMSLAGVVAGWLMVKLGWPVPAASPRTGTGRPAALLPALP